MVGVEEGQGWVSPSRAPAPRVQRGFPSRKIWLRVTAPTT